MSQESCLYTGTIEHRRFTPVNNSFTYSVCYYYLDLDEVKNLFRFPLLFSFNSPGILSFWRKDYLGDRKQDLKTSVSNFILQETGEKFNGRIKLLTNISYFGFCMNPVSFYYCFSNETNELLYLVSEITNTPWGEKHKQCFPFSGQLKKVFQFKKDFHVSPFIPMNVDYTWFFHRPEKNLTVMMQNRFHGKQATFFDSTLSLVQRELTAKNIIFSFLKFPFVTFKTMLAIYYQALKLYLKKAPFYSHPKLEKDYDSSTITQR